MIQRSVSGWPCGGRVGAWWSGRSPGGLLLPRPHSPRVGPSSFLPLLLPLTLLSPALYAAPSTRAVPLMETEGLHFLLAFAWREGEGRVGASLQATFML